MLLQPQETERFYRIWFPLLRFVNAQRQLVPDFPAQPTPGSIKPDEAGKIRSALWADNSLLDQFIAENPAALPSADLEMVASWKQRVAGKFFVVKHLKKYSVFLDDREPPHAYGVMGLVSPIEDIIGPYLPILVEAVLLPFEDKIIYDSLLAPYRITFGGGIRARLNTTYRDAQEREGIITSLLPSKPSDAEEAGSVQERNAKMLNEFRKALYKSGLSPKMVEQHVSNVETLNAFLLSQDPPRLLREIKTRDLETFLGRGAVEKATITSFKRLVRFLHDSERLDSHTARDLQDLIKLY
jgi:hypothetical protein